MLKKRSKSESDLPILLKRKLSKTYHETKSDSGGTFISSLTIKTQIISINLCIYNI